jgi:hypothetical protein
VVGSYVSSFVRVLCQVDIIISEWMGYFLLYESMLDTVRAAFDSQSHSTCTSIASSACL